MGTMVPFFAGAAVFLAVLIVIVVFVWRSRTRRARERAEEYRKAARLRGWELEYDSRRPQQFRYSGVTEGISWSFLTATPNPAWPSEARRNPARWETTDVMFDSGALAVYPGAADQRLRPDAPKFVTEMALRPIVVALGGDAPDAPVLASATRPLAAHAKYAFRTSNMQRMAGWLLEGANAALAEIRLPDLIAIVLWHRGLQIAISRGTHDLDAIERIVTLGVRLAHAAEASAHGPRTKPPEGGFEQT
jgi:hypothetical protein